MTEDNTKNNTAVPSDESAMIVDTPISERSFIPKGLSSLVWFIVITWVAMALGLGFILQASHKSSMGTLNQFSDIDKQLYTARNQLSQMNERITHLDKKYNAYIKELLYSASPIDEIPTLSNQYPSVPTNPITLPLDQNVQNDDNSERKTPPSVSDSNTEHTSKKTINRTQQYTLDAATNEIERLEEKVDELNNQLHSSLSNKQANVLLIAALSLRDAINNASDYNDELTHLIRISPYNDIISQIDTLKRHSDNIIPTKQVLHDEFITTAGHIMMYVKRQNKPDNLWDKAGLLMNDYIKVRKIGGNIEGNDPESILARAERAILDHDIVTALKEMQKLRGSPRNIAKNWTDLASRYTDVQNASRTIVDFSKSIDNNQLSLESSSL